MSNTRRILMIVAVISSVFVVVLLLFFLLFIIMRYISSMLSSSSALASSSSWTPCVAFTTRASFAYLKCKLHSTGTASRDMVSSGNVDSFKSTMFPDAESWQLQPSITHDNLAIYVRGSPLRFSTSLVCHGCPLSVAFVIVREGLLAGQGHHYKKKRTVNGILVISEGELGERIRHARDRITTYRDTQWSRGPSGWSTPCVLAFPINVNSVSILGDVGGCKKSCVPCHIGTRIALP